MSNKIHYPNSEGKYEFQFAKEIGKNYKSKSEFSYRFALNKFKGVKETFEINDEICVFEGDINTFVSMLADVLADFEVTLIENKKSNWDS